MMEWIKNNWTWLVIFSIIYLSDEIGTICSIYGDLRSRLHLGLKRIKTVFEL